MEDLYIKFEKIGKKCDHYRVKTDCKPFFNTFKMLSDDQDRWKLYGPELTALNRYISLMKSANIS